MNAPIEYHKNFIDSPNELFSYFAETLNWERRDDAPRSEYYCNDRVFK